MCCKANDEMKTITSCLMLQDWWLTWLIQGKLAAFVGLLAADKGFKKHTNENFPACRGLRETLEMDSICILEPVETLESEKTRLQLMFDDSLD